MQLITSTPSKPERTARPRAGQKQAEERVMGYLFVLPLVLVIVVLVYYPLAQGLSMSLRSLNYAMGTPDRFIGLRNYVRVLQDPDTLQAGLNTLGYLAVALVLETIFGVVFAVTLNGQFPGRGIVLALTILPWGLPGIVSGLLWARIFNPSNGLLNNLLFRLGLIQNYQLWFSDSLLSIIFIGVVFVWSSLPLTILTLLAALQTIPSELYDASAVDGAGPGLQFRYITLPLLRPALAVALTIGTVNALAIFDQIYVLNGVGLTTRSIAQQIYMMTFMQLKFGQGTALAFWLTIVSLAFSVAYIRSLRSAR